MVTTQLTQDFTSQTKQLIDGLKGICANFGLGNDGNEYRIIVQTFLHKLLCDKFAHEMKVLEPALALSDDWIAAWQKLPKAKRQDLKHGARGNPRTHG